jgi:class 3 adenylate cyclase
MLIYCHVQPAFLLDEEIDKHNRFSRARSGGQSTDFWEIIPVVQNSKTSPKPEDTANVKYVFVDVVGFTKKRSVEAQSYVVGYLNAVITGVLTTTGVNQDKTILIPTGDGVAIALLNVGPYDLHMQIALQILRFVEEHTRETEDTMRKFNVRIGINQNEDNLILDINGNQNVAGRGISLAQRIMDKADGGQILVGRAVYETLIQREQYMQKFREFSTRDKHGEVISIYQFYASEHIGLNVDMPSVFAEKRLSKPKMTRFLAYYIAHAALEQQFLLSRKEAARDYAAVVLLYFRAKDSVEQFSTPRHEEPDLQTWKAGTALFAEQYEHYLQLEWHCLTALAHFIEQELKPYSDLFFDDGLPNFAFLRDEAVMRLATEWPEIAEEFRLEKRTAKTSPSASAQ